MRSCKSIGAALMVGLLAMGGPARAAGQNAGTGQSNLSGETTWFDTPEGKEAFEIMERARSNQITDAEFEQQRAQWRKKWGVKDEPQAPHALVPLPPDTPLPPVTIGR